jgi:molybdopterin converting factor small subunit
MTSPKLPYTKNMIELIHAIRQKMPAELRSGVRFSNPDILINMANFYHATGDITARLMIEELLTEVGEEWLQLLEKKDGQQQGKWTGERQSYRQLINVNQHKNNNQPIIKTKKRWGKTITRLTV